MKWTQGLTPFFKRIKAKCTITNAIILSGFLTALIYAFSFLFPFTDNAFVVNNIQPVAAQVEGYVTHLYVKNGDVVRRGQPLLSVFDKPYRYKVAQLKAELAAAINTLQAQKKRVQRAQKISDNDKTMFQKLASDDKKYQAGYKNESISLITLQNSQKDTQAAKDRWQAAIKQVEIEQLQLAAQSQLVESIKAQLNLAKVNLNLTTVRAQNNGIIQNLFLNVGTPITINQPIFSLVNTDTLYIQANFNETDLRDVKKGDKVTIFPRMYLTTKRFHGVVDSDYWGANRQLVDNRTQLQNVTNENQWILLPQRLPVIIRITDPDPDYPLRVGSSAYVYVHV